MFDIDEEVLDQIDAGDLPHAELLLFDLGGTLYGFWGGLGPITVEGVPYVGAGSLIQVEALNAGVDLSASPLQVRMRAVPESALTPDVLMTIDDEPYKNAPAYLMHAYFSRVTGDVVAVYRRWQGYVDRVVHNRVVGGEYTLVGYLEPRSLDHSRQGHRVRSDEDQKLLDPDDRFFEHAATTATELLPYGRAGSVGSSGAGGHMPDPSRGSGT